MGVQRPLLEIKDLSIGLKIGGKLYGLLDSASFEVNSGEIVGLVGESGSGKTLTALSIIGLLPADATIISGEILYEGRNILTMTTEEIRELRRFQIASIFQDPMNYLNSLMTIGAQVAEVAPAGTKKEILEASLDSLRKA